MEIAGIKVVVRDDLPADFFAIMPTPTNGVQAAAMLLGATQADIPGLWNAPGYPELTTGQLLQVASARVWQAT
jgi:hypothetical protein